MIKESIDIVEPQVREYFESQGLIVRDVFTEFALGFRYVVSRHDASDVVISNGFIRAEGTLDDVKSNVWPEHAKQFHKAFDGFIAKLNQ